MAAKISRIELRAMRTLTMACWWPSRFTGRVAPDWTGIAGELDALTGGAERRFEMGTCTLAELHQVRALRQLANDKVKTSG